jgi:hypothetical protein
MYGVVYMGHQELTLCIWDITLEVVLIVVVDVKVTPE